MDNNQQNDTNYLPVLDSDAVQKKSAVWTRDVIRVYEQFQDDNGIPCLAYDDGSIAIAASAKAQGNEFLFLTLASDLGSHLNGGDAKYVYVEDKILLEEISKLKRLDKEIMSHSSLRKDEQSAIVKSFIQVIQQHAANGASDVHFFIGPQECLHVGRINGVIDETPRYLKRAQVMRMIAAVINVMGSEYSTDDFDPDISIGTKFPNVPIKVEDTEHLVELRLQYRSLVKGNNAPKMLVVRIPKPGKQWTLDALKLDPQTKATFALNMQSSEGLIVVTGPTGSGKSSTLHALLNAKPTNAVVQTIEDPIETKSEDPFVAQGNANDAEDEIADLMRLDPDIGLVGEMRNVESAKQAVHLGRTGHLVLSSLHATSALSTLSRLSAMGISFDELGEDNLFKMIINQRLVPTLCDCATKVDLQQSKDTPSEVQEFWATVDTLASDETKNRLVKLAQTGKLKIRSANPCSKCGTGFSSRELVLEYIIFDDEVLSLIRKGANGIARLEQHLREYGWKSIQDRGWELIERGVADPMTVERVCKRVILDTKQPWRYS
ncbi:TPA: hypothetical protein I7682_17710 [Vibrio vulnificus]|nr:hypothetical protein [Vibrio vulnificus]